MTLMILSRQPLALLTAVPPPPRVRSLADKFLPLLGLVLIGYALDGKGFAYLGIPPLFVGEASMVAGIVVLVGMKRWAKLWESPQMLAVSAFVLWGVIRTVPFFDKYGLDTVRDAALYYYSAFAFIVAAMLISDPTRLYRMIEWYRRFAKFFLVGILLVFVIYHFVRPIDPSWPWGEQIFIIQEKEGDVLVHLGGIVVFLMSGMAGPVPARWTMLLALDVAAMGVIDRAGTVSFGAAMLLGMLHRPRGSVGWRMIGAILAAVMLLGVSGIRVEIPGGKNREFSFDQIVTNVVGIFHDTGNDGMDSTKEWRMDWWKDIIRDTFHGGHFWDGKGYGINLADDYGYQVGDRSLRSPHNGHMTILARMGVPGLALWALVQLTWGAAVLNAYYKTRRDLDTRWNAMFLFLGAFWLAFLINASFDVYLEGPMGGIWFWSVYGAGVGALWIYKHRPELLYQSGDEEVTLA